MPKSLHCVSAHTTHDSKHCLEEIRNIQRHLNNLRGVKLLNITKVTDITFGQKVDGHTLTTETDPNDQYGECSSHGSWADQS